jgi:hypothetical protein
MQFAREKNVVDMRFKDSFYVDYGYSLPSEIFIFHRSCSNMAYPPGHKWLRAPLELGANLLKNRSHAQNMHSDVF